VLEASGQKVELTVTVEVLEAVIGDEDVVICDHNNYGSRWLTGMYPNVFAGAADQADRDARTIELLHHYYRICHEHRGMLSNLGAGHHGKFDHIYGPGTVGSGRDKSLTNWDTFDRHYGPLLTGEVFGQASPGAPAPRRPAKPIWGVYTPINPDWPADYLHWGQRGYEVEFTHCVGEFDRHFRDKGWVHTHPYFFFNHKKRYRWFEWDGDEPKYAKDEAYYHEMGELFAKAVGDTPVPWLFRMDTSWQMKHSFETLAGIVNYWVCGGFAKWYPEEIAQVLARGDAVWTYSGTPGIQATSSALLEHVWRMWARGIGGHCEWLTTSPGDDPWFNCEGAETGMIYPGERFGIAGPIPSARLKLQRNAVQDLNLIDPGVRDELARSVPVTLWEQPPPVVRELPPEDWDSVNLTEGTQDENMAGSSGLDALWWAPIRRAATGVEEDR
ncbi:hypothetical protein LCGC14_2006270, partial [marine sediment metagenome]